MKNLTRSTLAAAAAAVVGLTVGVPDASADVCSSCNGGLIVNQSGSDTGITLWNGWGTYVLKPGHVSEWYTNFRDVDAFKLMGCNAVSYPEGYRYYTGQWYYITDSASLSLKVNC